MTPSSLQSFSSCARVIAFSCAAFTLNFFPLCAQGLAAAPTDQAAISQPLYPWKTESAKDNKNGTFQHCLVKNAFDNGTLLILAENNEGLQRLAIHFPTDVLQADRVVDLTLQVDGQDVFPVEGITSSPRVLTMNIPEVFPEQLRKGNILRIRGPEDDIAYQLKDTDKAVQALRDCVTGHKNPSLVRTKLAAISAADADLMAQEKAARTILPAEMQASVSDIEIAAENIAQNLDLSTGDVIAPIDAVTASEKELSKSKPTPEMPAIPVPVIAAADIPSAAALPVSDSKSAQGILPNKWQHIFSNLALAPQGKTTSAQKMNMVAPLQHVWKIDALKVGIHFGQPVDGSVLDQNAKHYMFNIRNHCRGQFIAEADTQKTTVNGVYRWQIAETVCATDKEEKITALLFATSKEETITVVFEGPMDEAARIIRLRNNVLELMNR